MAIRGTIKNKNKATLDTPRLIRDLGFLLVFLSLVILIFTFSPVVSEEIDYQVSRTTLNENSIDYSLLEPESKDFWIIIPKIKASSKVIPNVDPYDSINYQKALRDGVAHAKTSGLPGNINNTFLFSHSSVDFFQASRYNSVFYLINKLETDDEIIIYHQDKKYEYKVLSKKMVDPNEVSYLNSDSQNDTLTLMTCWPPGTTYKRLIVQAILE